MELASKARFRSSRARTTVLRTVVGLAAGAILVVTFLRLVSVGAVYEHLARLSVGFALLCGIVFLSAYVVRGLRWRCLLRPCEVSVIRAAAIYQVGTFVNWLLPIRGGELVMSLLLRRSDGIAVSRSLPAVGMDKAMDLLSVVPLLIVLPFIGLRLSQPLWVLLVLTLAVIVLAMAVLAVAAWRRERGLSLVPSVVLSLIPGRACVPVEQFVERFVDTLVALIKRPRLLLTAAGYTAIAIGLDALFCLLAFRAVGVHVAVPVVLYGYTFFNLSFILPSPPGQIGSNELVGLLIFSGAFGISRTGVGAMFLFSHPWTAILMTITGLACLSSMGAGIRGALQLSGRQQEGEAR